MATRGSPPSSDEPQGAGIVAVGFGGAVAAVRIVAIANARSAPVQRVILQSTKNGHAVDLTFGRRARAAFFLDSGHIVLVGLSPETAVQRWRQALALHREADDVLRHLL